MKLQKPFFLSGNQGGFFQKYICERNKEKMESFFITEYDKCMSKNVLHYHLKIKIWVYIKDLFEGT